MLPRRDSLAYKDTVNFSEEERVEMVIDDLLQHTISRSESVERIYEVLRGGDASDKTVQMSESAKASDYFHGVDCTPKGKVHVYHFSDCEGGEKCALFKYLSANNNMEKHLKRGHEYSVTRNNAGEFEWRDDGKTVDKERLQR